jgi:uncharacterized protein involved in outer membrane biogenesis
MLKKVLKGLGIALVLVMATGLALVLIRPTVPLGGLSPQVSWILTQLTGREQQVSGRFYLTPGEWTTFTAEQASVELSGGKGTSVYVSLASVRTTIHLWSALLGRLRFAGIQAADGSVRVVPASPDETAIDPSGSRLADAGIAVVLPVETGEIDLQGITVSIGSPADQPDQALHVQEVAGSFGTSGPGILRVVARVGEHGFRADLKTSSLSVLANVEKDWEYRARIGYKSVQARLTGTISGRGAAARLATTVEVSGQHMDDITSLFKRGASVNLPFSLQAEFGLSRGSLSAKVTEFLPGTQGLDFTLTAQGSNFSSARYGAVLTGRRIDLDVIKTLISAPDRSGVAKGQRVEMQEIGAGDTLLPEHIPPISLDLNVSLEELVMAGRSITDISLAAALQAGRLEVMPFQATFSNIAGAGKGVLDFQREEPELSLELEVTEIDVGGVLKDLGLVDEDEFLALSVARSRMRAESRGRTLAALRSQLIFSIEAREGVYRYQDPNTGGEVVIDLRHSSIAFNAGEKLALLLNGRVDSIPIDIALSIEDQQNSAWSTLDRLPLHFSIASGDTLWELDGHVPIPLSLSGVTLSSRFKGKQLSDLNGLLDLSLPDIGPYEMFGTFSRNESGYLLEGLRVQVGSSLLVGSAAIDTAVLPPQVHISLESPLIQLDDFRSLKEGASGSHAVGAGPGTQDEVAGSGPQPGPESDERRRFLSDQEVVESYNASVQVKVAEVLSGPDLLGGAAMHIEQRDGRLSIDPLEFRIPGGNVLIDLLRAPAGEKLFYRLNISIEDFDYGIIGRRIRPDTDMAGSLNLWAALEATSPDFRKLMENGSGSLNLSLHPQRMRTGVIDLWAVNLLSYLFSFLTDESQSRVNCLAGRFGLDSGRLTDEELLIDTSRIQIKGSVEIDFLSQQIRSYLRPIPKRPQFFSLATPIEIKGSFASPGVRLPATGVIGTIARVATSYIVVPIQWIILNKLPEDGSEQCLEIFAKQEIPGGDNQ